MILKKSDGIQKIKICSRRSSDQELQNGWEEIAKGRMFCYVRTRFNVATYATSNHVNFSEEKVKTVIYFSKVFFVKGKEGKRTSRSFSAGGGRASADPERVGEPTTERNQRKTPARRQQAHRKQKPENEGHPKRNRRLKQDRICNKRWTERLRTQTSPRKHAISTALHFFAYPIFFYFPLPSVSQKNVNAEISEKEENHWNPHFALCWKSGK